MSDTKTLYVRGVDTEVINHVTNHHLIKGFKSRGEFVNTLLKAGLQAYRSSVKKTTKKVAKKATKTTKKVAKKAKKATKKAAKTTKKATKKAK